jgi:hypothetical protein
MKREQMRRQPEQQLQQAKKTRKEHINERLGGIVEK